MPSMTRAHYNQIADTVAGFKNLPGITADAHAAICAMMSSALTGISSTYNADRFRLRCAGVRGGR